MQFVHEQVARQSAAAPSVVLEPKAEIAGRLKTEVEAMSSPYQVTRRAEIRRSRQGFQTCPSGRGKPAGRGQSEDRRGADAVGDGARVDVPQSGRRAAVDGYPGQPVADVGAGWGLALAVGLVGVAMTRRPARKKTAFVLIVAMVATLLPLVIASIEVAEVCNMLFYAACLLVPYYLAAGLVRWAFAWCCRKWAWCAALVLAVSLAAGANAEPPTAKPQAADGPYVIQIVAPPAPVSVPEDAVVLPYDPDAKSGIKAADKLLVPYEKYVELWNRAHPDKKIETKSAPRRYALAGAAYQTVLDDGEYLLLAGRIEIDVFDDGFVQVPLRLDGGVLAQAELDGKPARLSVAGALASLAASDSTTLYVSGKGRHKLELAVRLKLSHQGGWHVAEGVVPSAPATALTITVPKPQTEVRLGELSDRRSYDTQNPDEVIRTISGADGAVNIRWRPKVAEGQVDRSLTATSAAVLDVQEDGLRLAWRLDLEFRRSQRERFDVALPAEFLLEKVEGNNVRGWEIRKTDQGQKVEITLLEAAKDREQFTLHLWRSGTVGQAKLAEFDVPLVSVSDAALNSGQLTIRRSPLLELRTLEPLGRNADRPARRRGRVDRRQGKPAGHPAVRGLQLRRRAVCGAVGGRADRGAGLGHGANRAAHRPVRAEPGKPHHLRRARPADLPVANAAARRLQGRSRIGPRRVPVRRDSAEQAAAVDDLPGHGPARQRARAAARQTRPRGGTQGTAAAAVGGVKVDSQQPVDRQQGDLAVQVDPAFDVDAADLKNCQRVLLGQLYAWLNPAQQRVTRLGLHYTRGDYSGTLRLTPRRADVVCDTISNVRVTDRAIEETILLDFTIRNAGVRELSFLLPAEMAGSRISVPMLRQKTVEPVGKEAGAALRVRIELQDEVMDQLRILVENDRLLTPGARGPDSNRGTRPDQSPLRGH